MHHGFVFLSLAFNAICYTYLSHLLQWMNTYSFFSLPPLTNSELVWREQDQFRDAYWLRERGQARFNGTGWCLWARHGTARLVPMLGEPLPIWVWHGLAHARLGRLLPARPILHLYTLVRKVMLDWIFKRIQLNNVQYIFKRLFFKKVGYPNT